MSAPRTVLVLAPRFAPVNAPDGERARTCAVHFERFGWRPVILCVDPAHSTMPLDPALRDALPGDLEVHAAPCLARPIARAVRLSDPGLLAAPWLLGHGSRLIRERRVDLVYASTTAFTALPLGRLWRRRHGVSFVVDLHDPWVDEEAPLPGRALKHRVMRALNRRLEPFTMDAVDGLVTVSPGYVETLARRYPRLAAVPRRVLPFAVSGDDLARAREAANPCFTPGDGRVHVVHTGAVPAAMAPVLDALLEALRLGLERDPARYRPLTLHFLGTRYHDHGAVSPVQAAAARAGVSDHVVEHPRRRPLYEALRAQLDAALILVLGSAAAHYAPSKAVQCLLAGPPVLGLCHAASAVHETAAALGCDTFLAFDGERPDASAVASILDRVLGRPRRATRPEAAGPYLAEASAEAQCALFDEVLARASRPCAA